MQQESGLLGGLTEAVDLIMCSGRLRLQQYLRALLASLLKTTRKKKTKGPWRDGQQKRRRGVRKRKAGGGSGGRAHQETVEAGEEVVEDEDVAVDGEEGEEAGDRGQEENAAASLQA